MAEKEIILELDYRISPEDFYTFSVRSMNRQYAARAKKTNFTGILKLLVGILVLGYVIYARQTAMIQSPLMNEVVLVLAVVIFGYGVYCFSYYRWIFPYLVKKYARSGYKNSSYLQNPIRLRFYSTGFDEESEQNTLSFRWQQFKRVVLEEDIYMLELREGGRTLLIPRHALGEEKIPPGRTDPYGLRQIQTAAGHHLLIDTGGKSHGRENPCGEQCPHRRIN